MRDERAVERRAGLVGQRRLARGADRLGALGRGARRAGELLDDVQQVALAAFVGGAVAFDEPAAAGNLQPERRVLAQAAFERGEPALDGRLFEREAMPWRRRRFAERAGAAPARRPPCWSAA